MEVPDKTTVGGKRTIQLDQYEPIVAEVSETYTVPDGMDYDEYQDWRDEKQDAAMAAAERSAMRRHEEYVREEALGDD